MKILATQLRLSLLAGAALALVLATLVGAASPDTPEARAKQADRYLAVVPPKDTLADMVEKMAETLPAVQQAAYKDAMLKHLDVNALQKAMRTALIKNFSTDELAALADFYGSAVGKSAMKKMGQYMADVMPTLQTEVEKAVTAMAQSATK